MDGFFWVDCQDHENSVMSFVRQTKEGRRQLLVVLNLTPVLRTSYRIGLPRGGHWKEILNSDSEIYGGANHGNLGGVWTENYAVHSQQQSALFALPPMSVMVFRPAE
jgi:1,4-alpha-glucan branching enzyme